MGDAVGGEWTWIRGGRETNDKQSPKRRQSRSAAHGDGGTDEVRFERPVSMLLAIGSARRLRECV